MSNDAIRQQLEGFGITNVGEIIYNGTTARLVEESVVRGDGHLTRGGALAVLTGQHTGRSVQDRFVVREPSSENHVWW